MAVHYELVPVVFFLAPIGTDIELALGQLALCGGYIVQLKIYHNALQYIVQQPVEDHSFRFLSPAILYSCQLYSHPIRQFVTLHTV